MAIRSEHFGQYERSNESMVRLLSRQVGKIDDKVREIEEVEESREDEVFRYISNPLNPTIAKDKDVVHCSYYSLCDALPPMVTY